MNSRYITCIHWNRRDGLWHLHHLRRRWPHCGWARSHKKLMIWFANKSYQLEHGLFLFNLSSQLLHARTELDTGVFDPTWLIYVYIDMCVYFICIYIYISSTSTFQNTKVSTHATAAVSCNTCKCWCRFRGIALWSTNHWMFELLNPRTQDVWDGDMLCPLDYYWVWYWESFFGLWLEVMIYGNLSQPHASSISSLASINLFLYCHAIISVPIKFLSQSHASVLCSRRSAWTTAGSCHYARSIPAGCHSVIGWIWVGLRMSVLYFIICSWNSFYINIYRYIDI